MSAFLWILSQSRGWNAFVPKKTPKVARGTAEKAILINAIREKKVMLSNDDDHKFIAPELCQAQSDAAANKWNSRPKLEAAHGFFSINNCFPQRRPQRQSLEGKDLTSVWDL